MLSFQEDRDRPNSPTLLFPSFSFPQLESVPNIESFLPRLEPKMDFENPEHLVVAAQKIRRHFIKNAFSAPLSVKQQETIRNDPVVGPVWVSKFSLPIPTNDTSRDALIQLVDEQNVHRIQYDRPPSTPLNFEWVGYRNNAKRDTPEPLITEKEKFDRLSAETTGPLNILYIYGGTFVYDLDPSPNSLTYSHHFQPS